MIRIGLDIGSTTMKVVALSEENRILHSRYNRHLSRIEDMALEQLEEIFRLFPGERFSLALSGSAGMGLAEDAAIPFVQEVYATNLSVKAFIPGTDTVIELGGEDAKILFLSGGMEVRMNGTCAGGTGAFIDQMAALMNVEADQLESLSQKHERTYAVASRCGVFAKSDIQPLLNQGARKEDVARSIFEAVVNQTIAGLAQGRRIEGNVAYLGGPLTFFSELRDCFNQALHLQGVCPENSLFFVALGAALYAGTGEIQPEEILQKIRLRQHTGGYASVKPLFESQEEYEAFCRRHAAGTVETNNAPGYAGQAYIGIDAGSTTVKAVAVDDQARILKSAYLPNGGNPIPPVKRFLEEFYREYPSATLAGAYATGYGEQLIRAAFRLDGGVVETVAHFTAAKQFLPEVDFIIDIGGQDIKCFRIRDGAIDDLFLNEACSSGCGSFLQAFATTWGLSVEEFAKKGLFAPRPVDMGSRCTVFMNSSVKQAQKDGASLENISAGLSISVVKNALYKVIRTSDATALGKHIVVQGGTFLNDAVLRAFEREIDANVVRPNIAGLMGAYGAALCARGKQNSSTLRAEELAVFQHQTSQTRCKGCQNHCLLTINRFDSGRSYISGNRCERPEGAKKNTLPNQFSQKRQWLAEIAREPVSGAFRGKIGLPLGLNLYEMLPFWHALFSKLGFEVVVSPESTRKTYLEGQHTIPSDTVCYPAKLMHGHVEWLIRQGVDAIFYPCLTYNFDEHRGDNHYNCPVVAYYPEVLRLNVPELKSVRFISDYLGPHRPREFRHKMYNLLNRHFPGIDRKEVDEAVNFAYRQYGQYMDRVRARGEEILRESMAQNRPVIVLAGRPYHIDPEVSHGIEDLITSMGAAVVTEDAVCHLASKVETKVLNQWTYHSRLYAAAKFVAENPYQRLNLVQLVSFGCGVDAITTDEVRRILHERGKLYTQIKIDEITNLGAVRIRLRSLFAALGQEEAHG